MEKKPLILVGGGGHCKSVIDVAESAGYVIMGILDKPEEVGKQVLAYKVIGTDDDIPMYVDKAEFVITVGQIKSTAIRHRIAEKIEKAGGKLATVIASDATVSKYATIGEGSVILHKCVVNADARIGRNCIINTMANVEHEVEIGDFCHISTGVMVNGMTKIGNETFIGSGSVLYNCIEVPAGSIIPAGTIVRR
ncbi:MAG: acetyltransferase [Bacteroidaceae bacterium]|nr:acetyltransferase [Bacteroidaceae bacterium]